VGTFRVQVGGAQRTDKRNMAQHRDQIDLTTDSGDATGHTDQLRPESRETTTHRRSAADFDAHLDLAAKIALDVVAEVDDVRRCVVAIGGFAHVSRRAQPLCFFPQRRL
jgi:hypothetical protein